MNTPAFPFDAVKPLAGRVLEDALNRLLALDEASRDKLRMDLAAQGLPAAGGAGYELLDGMSGFGTTSQMFDAAYWRAKEGELARTILALPNVRTARVHLAVPSGRGYRREAQATASVRQPLVSVQITLRVPVSAANCRAPVPESPATAMITSAPWAVNASAATRPAAGSW